jgi:excisionase family DNA binding protein
MEPEYLDSEQTRMYLSVSLSTLNALCRDMGLPFYRLGRKRLFKRAELDAFMESRRGAHMSAAIEMPKGKKKKSRKRR